MTSPFAKPRGLRGRLAGRFMLLLNKHHELLDVLDVPAGGRLLEVGFGPGGLIRMLAERTRAERICGVDPSDEMVAAAARHNRSAVAAGRVELRSGSAADTGYPDAHFDRIVSTNTVAIWPDLEAGLRELHRVVRPGGTVVLAWHGGTNPHRIARGLRLPDDKLDRLRRGLEELFGTVTRHELKNSTVFRATRPAER